MQFHYSNVCPRCQDGVWIWGAAKYVCCLRRGTFVLRRKKGTKERRKKPRFLDFLSAPRTFQVVGVRPTRLGAMQGALNVGSSPRAPSYRSPTCRPKRNPNPWFWRAFGYFSRAGKVTRGRHTSLILHPSLFSTQNHVYTSRTGFWKYNPPAAFSRPLLYRRGFR